MDRFLLDILNKFGVSDTDVISVQPYGDGHINSTYKIVAKHGEYLLQKINHNVFTNPKKLMENFENITNFLKAKIIKNGGNPDRETLTIIKSVDNESFIKTENGEYYRLMLLVDAISINEADDPKVLFSVAQAFGKFQKMLADYPADTLFEVIENFHNTPNRFLNFEIAVKENKCDRLKNVTSEVEYVNSVSDRLGLVVDAIKDKSIPLRVTHNDTKLNNVLLDKDTKECVCVIDLDTIMSGSYLYDYGDALRFAGSSAAEDETDIEKVYFDMEKFAYFTKGYLSEVREVLTDREIELLPFSVELLTIECGIRFLTDYLNGDTYFKIAYSEHNLDRARNQFKLARDIDLKLKDMSKYIYGIIEK